LPGVESVQEFAERAALGTPPQISDLRRDEIVDVIDRATTIGGPHSNYYLNLLMRSFPYASPSDLIYWPDRERSNEEIADEILLRKQLFENGSAQAVNLHILQLANAVIADPNSPLWAREWASSVLGNSAKH
jgi:hypothetical protein